MKIFRLNISAKSNGEILILVEINILDDLLQ
jgi:hypothetical protein